MSRRFKVSSLSLAALLLAACADDGAGADTTSTGDTSTAAADPPATSTGEAPTTTGEPGTGSTGDASTDATTTDATTTEGATDGMTGEDLCADSVLTWENFGEPFALSWCTGCHHSALPTAERAGAPCGVNLDTHAGASQFAPRCTCA